MDRKEAERLVVAFAPSVYRLAFARTGNRADAEDVTQEVFLRLVRRKEPFREEEHAKAWLLRVTVNCAGDMFRSPWRKRRASWEDLPETAMADTEEHSGVLEAVLALPPLYRAPVHLFYYEGLSVAEIARVLGKSEGSVRTRLSRARTMLRGLLTEGGEDLV